MYTVRDLICFVVFGPGQLGHCISRLIAWHCDDCSSDVLTLLSMDEWMIVD